ncbi:hypothetical protein [Thioalkalivibrio sp. HK1]|uniref:hypothetical protein n=1 Tax=Thioalkalivibrio sp. HK1 TaxID=1469245 RepID=UPI0004718291|nr:hypothetical protein [Thioalkalivibrio sp. HK1]
MMQTPDPGLRDRRAHSLSEKTSAGMKSGQYPNITPPEPMAPGVGEITRRLATWFWLPISLFALTLGVGWIHYENRLLDQQNDIDHAARNAMLDAIAVDVLQADIGDDEGRRRIAEMLPSIADTSLRPPPERADWRALADALQAFSNIDPPATSTTADLGELQTIGSRMIRLSDRFVERLGDVGVAEIDFNRLMSDAVGQANLIRRIMAGLRAIGDSNIDDKEIASQRIQGDFADFGSTLEAMLEGRSEAGIEPIGNRELRGILKDTADLHRTMRDPILRIVGNDESERRHEALRRTIIDRIDDLRRIPPPAAKLRFDLPVPTDIAFAVLAALTVIVLLAMAMGLTRQGGRINDMVRQGDLLAIRNTDTSRKTLDTLKARDRDISHIKGSLGEVRKKMESLVQGDGIEVDGVDASEVAPLIRSIGESIDHLAQRMHALQDTSGELAAKARSIRENTDSARDIGERHGQSLQEASEAFRSLYQNSAAIESTAVEVARSMVEALGSIAGSGKHFQPSAATMREIVEEGSSDKGAPIDPMVLADEGMRSLRELESELMEVAETGRLLMLNLALRRGSANPANNEVGAFITASDSSGRLGEDISALCERARDAAAMVAEHRDTLLRAIEGAVAADGERIEGDRASPEYLQKLLARAEAILAGAKEQALRHRAKVDGTERLVAGAKDIADEAQEKSALVATEVDSLALLADALDRDLTDLSKSKKSPADERASSKNASSTAGGSHDTPEHD